ncbi:Fatty acyl-CoA reductase [Mycobacteroides abscessus subsp. abscessus]|nr:Fatty acyl-CoA reductase [Mycobacteroides abscessus subsp. abscessus]SLE22140.1 Fatty acyl-CoA reductase [Mycobacteroides abscessus subsp. abscessus]SLH50768.1 Fatty acyl-CoA reductase [Mycobacteroides abscessus subsp. abscessus]SLI34056.1 fatty acyl-CoA reductase [Mycobacteroides abscessus subsp. abscessus]
MTRTRATPDALIRFILVSKNSFGKRVSTTLARAAMQPFPSLPLVRARLDPNYGAPIKGKRVLITGASSGIGEEAAYQFGKLGAKVIVVARREDLLAEVAARIIAEGGEAEAIACDLSDLDAIDKLVETVNEKHGGVDILVNNAGRSIRRKTYESLDRWHDAERTMQLNYFSPLRLIRGFAPGMVERRSGHIINVATWGVLTDVVPQFAVYNASKAALSTVSRIVDAEYGKYNVHTTTLYFPLVRTPMIAPTEAYTNAAALTSAEAAEWMVLAARTRVVRIAPRISVMSAATNAVAPDLVTRVARNGRETLG